MGILHSKNYSITKKLFNKIFIQKIWKLFIQKKYSSFWKIDYRPGLIQQNQRETLNICPAGSLVIKGLWNRALDFQNINLFCGNIGFGPFQLCYNYITFVTSLCKNAKIRNLENFRQIVARPDEREKSFREASEKGNIILEKTNFFLFFSFVWRIKFERE